MNTSETSDTVLNSFVRDEGIIQYIQDSYYNFITKLIPETVNASNVISINFTTDQDIKIEIIVKLSNPILHSPQFIENDGTITRITPQECRLRRLNYSGQLFVDSNIKIYTLEESKVINDEDIDYESLPLVNKKLIYENNETLLLCNIPIMIQSKFCYVNKGNKMKMKECEKDYGGYYIINGSEKIIVSQERMTNNEIYIFPSKVDCLKAEIKSSDNEKKLLTSFYLYYMYPNRQTNKVIRTEIQFIKKEIKLLILFRALGITNVNDIIYLVCGDDAELKNEFTNTIEDCENMEENELDTNEICDDNIQKNALEYIGDKMSQGSTDKIKTATDILTKTFIPHIGFNLFDKAFFLAQMCRKLLETSLGRREFDDRDHYGNKRVDLSGELIHLIFQRGYDKMYKELYQEISRLAKKKLNNLQFIQTFSLNTIINSKIITKELNYALSTGNWGNTKTGASKSGVSQVSTRLNLLSMYSQLRRLTTPSGKNATTSKPRQLHNTQFAIACPSETPEGQSTGFLKNTSFLIHISLGYPSEIISHIINDLDLKPLKDYDKYQDFATLWINGKPIGYFEDADLLYYTLKKYKKESVIPIDTQVYHDVNEKKIKLWTDSGRCSHPVFVVENNKILITSEEIQELKDGKLKWQDLIHKGYIEYLDAKECENSVIAISLEKLFQNEYEYTHCEINPAVILGVPASIAPFPNRQPAPRTTYECLSAEEMILMSNGRYKKLRDVQIGNNIKTIDPFTFEITDTRVIDKRMIETDKIVYKIFTHNNKTVVATEDHLFLTNDGWKMIKDIRDERVLIYESFPPRTGDLEDSYVLHYYHITKIISSHRLVVDITTQSENHSFITNSGYIVHNCGMSKQAMGANSMAFRYRMDTNSHLLWYPQVPLIHTKQYKMLEMDYLPTETNCVVAICSLNGYNQEDGLILNQSSVDRGLFRSTYFKTYMETENKSSNNSAEEYFFKSENKKSHKLSQDGLPETGIRVKEGDRIIDKVGEKKNSGTELHQVESAIIDKTMITTTDKGQKLVKVGIRIQKTPEIGDKFASRYAQKGVCCMMVRDEDMPYTKDGIRPDVIINALGQPSRMTIGHLIECMTGKYACISGKYQDASIDNDMSPLEVGKMLKEHGFSEGGKEMLIDGRTGKMMMATSFIGVNAYQRLKHLISEKIQYRARGPVTMLTRQPINFWSVKVIFEKNIASRYSICKIFKLRETLKANIHSRILNYYLIRVISLRNSDNDRTQ